MAQRTLTAGAFYGYETAAAPAGPLVSEAGTGVPVQIPAAAPGIGIVSTVLAPAFWRSDRAGFIWWFLLMLYVRKRIGSLVTD